MSTQYRKHFIPLESNPEVFTNLVHRLGVSNTVQFVDVLSLEDPDLLAFIPRPALALVLVFPTSTQYESQKARDEGTRTAYSGSGDGEDVVWFKQTINNACGLYGLLHAVSNGEARSLIQPNSTLANILAKAIPLPPAERALVLEDDPTLEDAHTAAAKTGDSQVPDAEDEVDYHYLCYVKSNKSGHLYLLDGDRKGPVDLGDVLGTDEDVLSEPSLSILREFVGKEQGRNIGFNLLALVPQMD